MTLLKLSQHKFLLIEKIGAERENQITLKALFNYHQLVVKTVVDSTKKPLVVSIKYGTLRVTIYIRNE